MSCEQRLPIAFDIFQSVVSGDDTQESVRIVIDDTETDLVSVTIHAKLDIGSSAVDFSKSSTNNEIVINGASAGNWDFTIPNMTVPLAAGAYQVHLSTLDSLGARLTYFYQENWRITASI